MTNSRGRFLWYDLITTDMAAAKAFYCNVVGWGALDASMYDKAYTLFTVAEGFVGGLMALPDEARQTGAQSRWIGYVGVDDVNAAAEQIARSGGAVQVPPTEVPHLSRFAIVNDPQLASLGLFTWLAPGQEAPALGTPGRVGWHELFADDCDQAWVFYSALFGWQKGLVASGTMGSYQLFSAGGQTIGGIFTKPATFAAPFWLYYFNVGDIDAASGRVQAGGGRILNGPIEAPDGSWILQCTDPQGAMFALLGRRSYKAVSFMERIASLD